MSSLNDILKRAASAYGSGKREQAIKLYLQAEKLNPNCTEALEWLGELHVQIEKLEEAVSFYERALPLNKDFAEFANLGYCYYELGESGKAVDALQKAITLDANDETSHSNYGKALYDYFININKDKAKKWALQWQQEFSHNKDALHMGAAISGKACPKVAASEFVRETFDDFSEDFDIKLAELEYQAPALLAELAQQHQNAKIKNIADLGCGTGLVAIHLKTILPKAKIYGVDLSSKMINKAKKRKLYSKLETNEIITWLNLQADKNKKFELIIAADVLCYFGDLQEFIQTVTRCLTPQAILVFSLETASQNEINANQNYILHASGRYKHSKNYPQILANNAGLTLLEARSQAVLRTEYAAPVFGTIIAMIKD